MCANTVQMSTCFCKCPAIFPCLCETIMLQFCPTMLLCGRRGGLMVSALDAGSNSPCSSPGQGTVLCSWARHLTVTVPLSIQVYKWVPANLLLGVTQWTRIPSRGGVEILLVASCYRNKDKLWPDEPLGSTAGFFTNLHVLYMYICHLFSMEGITCTSIYLVTFPAITFLSVPVSEKGSISKWLQCWT